MIDHDIRIATRLNYHLEFCSAIRARGKEHTYKAPLWYVLYIIVHHSSILYGRPAVISPAEEPHQQWETIIQSGGSCEIDLRMANQVALYLITAKVKEIFSTYSTPTVPDHFLHQLRGYFSELDRWYTVWGNRVRKKPPSHYRLMRLIMKQPGTHISASSQGMGLLFTITSLVFTPAPTFPAV